MREFCCLLSDSDFYADHIPGMLAEGCLYDTVFDDSIAAVFGSNGEGRVRGIYSFQVVVRHEDLLDDFGCTECGKIAGEFHVFVKGTVHCKYGDLASVFGLDRAGFQIGNRGEIAGCVSGAVSTSVENGTATEG